MALNFDITLTFGHQFNQSLIGANVYVDFLFWLPPKLGWLGTSNNCAGISLSGFDGFNDTKCWDMVATGFKIDSEMAGVDLWTIL